MNIIESLDIFGVPFEFNVNKKSTKYKTVFGGIIFIIIASLSILYFCYQNYLFFSGQYSGKSTLSRMQIEVLEKFEINNGLIAFEIALDHDVKLSAYQQKVGKKFVDFVVSIVSVSKAGVKSIDLDVIPCKDPKLSGYLCIDISKLTTPLTLDYNPSFSSAWQKNLKIQVIKCEGKPECASSQEIEDLIMQIRNQFQIITKFLQFNYNTKQFEYTYKLDVYGFDPNLSFYSNMNMQKTDYKLQEGFLVLKETKQSGITSTQKTIEYKQTTFLQDKLKQNVYGIVIFYLLDKIEQVDIIYPLYTETFAQFASIFGMLMIFGNIGSIFSKIKMDESITNIFISEQFKSISQKYLEKSNESKSQQLKPTMKENILKTDINGNKEKQNNQIQINDKNINLETYCKILSDNLKSLKNQNTISCIKQQKNKKNKNKQQKIQSLEEVQKENKDIDNLRIKAIEQHVQEKINVVDMYRNIVQMKMMIRMLLSQEQYSAIQFCTLNLDIIANTKIRLSKENQIIIQEKQSINRNDQNKKNNSNQEMQLLSDNNINHNINNSKINENKTKRSGSDEENMFKTKIDNQETQIKLANNIEQKLKIDKEDKLFVKKIDSIKKQEEQKNISDEINHLDKLEIIDIDENELYKNLNNFLKTVQEQFQQNGQIDPLSQRIVNCLFIPQEGIITQENN